MGGAGKRNSKKKEKSNLSKPNPTHGQPEIVNVNHVRGNEDLERALYQKVMLQYQKAFEKLLALNHSKDVASRAILMNGSIYGPSCTIYDNIIGNCVSYIETGHVIDAGSVRGGKPIFKDLEEEATYAMKVLIDMATQKLRNSDEAIKALVSDKILFREEFSGECSNSKVVQKESGRPMEDNNDEILENESERLLKESEDSLRKLKINSSSIDQTKFSIPSSIPQKGSCDEETDQILDNLTKQLHERKRWAEETVIQTAKRLSLDLIQLCKLRFENMQTERLKKEEEEITSRNETKLAEMEHTLRKYNCNVASITGHCKGLETDNLAMKAEISAFQLSTLENESALRLVEKEEKRCLRMLKNKEKQVDDLKRQIDEEKEDIAKTEEKLLLAREAEMDAKMRQMREVEAKKQARLLCLEEERLNKKAKDESRRRLAAVRQELDGAKKQLIQKTAGGGVVSSKYSCLICREKMANVLFLPCKHLVICEECNAITSDILAEGCPCCKDRIQNRIKVFGIS